MTRPRLLDATITGTAEIAIGCSEREAGGEPCFVLVLHSGDGTEVIRLSKDCPVVVGRRLSRARPDRRSQGLAPARALSAAWGRRSGARISLAQRDARQRRAYQQCNAGARRRSAIRRRPDRAGQKPSPDGVHVCRRPRCRRVARRARHRPLRSGQAGGAHRRAGAGSG